MHQIAHVDNSCDRDLAVRVTFTILDDDEFELDSDNEDAFVPPHGTGKARGEMLVRPPEKARRMARQGASIALRKKVRRQQGLAAATEQLLFGQVETS